MPGSTEMQHEQGAPRADAGAWPHLAVARSARRGALVALLAGSLMLPVLALAAGQGASRPEQTAAAATPQGSAPHKVSPHIKASRDRAQAPKPEHRTKLQLSARGVQKAGSR
jgi:hypothetical protein